MKFSEYISTHHVFLTGSLFKNADSEMAAKQQRTPEGSKAPALTLMRS